MIRAVLFDRDGTLIVDRGGLTLMPGAEQAISRLRAFDMKLGVVTNQPRAGSAPHARREMHGLHRRIETLVGKFDGWFVCTHPPQHGCACRKPQPGLIVQAAQSFGVATHDCVVIGDIGSDVEAALRAGAQAILVPTPVTRAEEVAAAPVVCRDLRDAVDRVIAQVPA
jgi:histidinol-phosphate phosphatase family protein